MGSYLLRSANQTAPLDILEAQFANNGQYIGVAIPENGVVQIERFKTLDGLKAAFEVFADANVHIYFSNTDNGEEDRQPYVLLKAKEEEKIFPLLVCMIDADMSSFNKTGSTYSDAYHCVEDEIQPYIDQIKEVAEGDMDKIWKAINGEKFKEKIQKLWIGYGTIAFINGDGNYVILEDSKTSQNFEWGHASRVYKPGAYPASSVAAKGRTLAAALQADAASSGVPVSPVPAAPPASPPAPVAPPAPGTSTAVPSTAGSSAFPPDFLGGKIVGNRWFPPTNLQGKPLKAVVRQANKEFHGLNELPVGFGKNNYAPIDIPAAKLNPPAVKSLNELPQVVGNTVLAAPAAPASSGGAVTEEKEPILDDKIVEAVKDDFLTRFDFTKKIVDEHGKFLIDPESLGANESKYPTFIQKMGLSQLEDVLLFDYGDCEVLNRKYPDAGAVLTFNLINAHIGLLQQINALKDRLAKHEPPTIVAAPKAALTAPVAPAPSGKKRVIL